jgi:transcriptional regulator with XRE-family HTH domain
MSKRKSDSTIIGFGKRLKALREKRGFTQEGLAREIKVTSINVSRWERDIILPQADRICALKYALDTTCEYLLIGYPPELDEFLATEAGLYAQAHNLVGTLLSMRLPPSLSASRVYLAVVLALSDLAVTGAG